MILVTLILAYKWPCNQKPKGSVSHYQFTKPSCAVTPQRVPSSSDGFRCMDHPLTGDVIYVCTSETVRETAFWGSLILIK